MAQSIKKIISFLQQKYRRDQEKLEEEFRKAQQEAVTEGTKQYQEVLTVVYRTQSAYLSKNQRCMPLKCLPWLIIKKNISGSLEKYLILHVLKYQGTY